MIGFDALFIDALLALGVLGAGGGALGILGLRARLRRHPGARFAIIAPASRGSPEALFMSLHGLRRSPLRVLTSGQPHLSFEIVGRDGRLHFQLRIPDGQRDFVEAVLKSAYPGLQLTPIASAVRGATSHASARLGLAGGDYLPVRTTVENEPLSALCWMLARAKSGEEVALELQVRPASSAWQTQAHLEARKLRAGPRASLLPGIVRDPRPMPFERSRAKAIEEKAACPGFDCVLRIRAETNERARADELVRSVAASLGPFTGANSFVLRSRDRGTPADQARERFPLFGHFVLNARELAALWHLPSEAPPQLAVVRSAVLPPPLGADAGERTLGVSSWAGANRPVRLSIADSRYHLHLLGSTGTGKTTALLNLAAADIAAGRGVGVLDPKGDLVRGLLERIPRERVNDVVLISPDETSASVGLNPLELWPGDDLELVADNAVTIFKRIYERYWGPRTDDVLKATLLTLLRRPGTTLAQIPVLLTDGVFRHRTLAEVHDPFGLDGFWRWFEGLSESQRTEAIGPVLNKLRDFLLRSKLRRLLCQSHSTVDLRSVVDSGKIVLADLSVGRWGDATSALIGSFLVARIWQAVLARASLSEDQRRDFFLFVDEFQHFLGVAGPFADVLAEARSLRLSLTIANQHLGQLTRDLRESVASNARSRIVFQCGQDDAAYLAREFAPLTASELMSLGRFEAAARIAIGGRSSEAFSLRTLPPAEITDAAQASSVRTASAWRFGRPVDAIDQELRQALGPDWAEGSAKVAEGRRRR